MQYGWSQRARREQGENKELRKNLGWTLTPRAGRRKVGRQKRAGQYFWGKQGTEGT